MPPASADAVAVAAHEAGQRPGAIAGLDVAGLHQCIGIDDGAATAAATR